MHVFSSRIWRYKSNRTKRSWLYPIRGEEVSRHPALLPKAAIGSAKVVPELDKPCQTSSRAIMAESAAARRLLFVSLNGKTIMKHEIILRDMTCGSGVQGSV
jgi:hypothetical protein